MSLMSVISVMTVVGLLLALSIEADECSNLNKIMCFRTLTCMNISFYTEKLLITAGNQCNTSNNLVGSHELTI